MAPARAHPSTNQPRTGSRSFIPPIRHFGTPSISTAGFAYSESVQRVSRLTSQRHSSFTIKNKNFSPPPSIPSTTNSAPAPAAEQAPSTPHSTNASAAGITTSPHNTITSFREKGTLSTRAIWCPAIRRTIVSRKWRSTVSRSKEKVPFSLPYISSSISSNRLYLHKRSERDGAPDLINSAFTATAMSAIVVSVVSPER